MYFRLFWIAFIYLLYLKSDLVRLIIKRSKFFFMYVHKKETWEALIIFKSKPYLLIFIHNRLNQVDFSDLWIFQVCSYFKDQHAKVACLKGRIICTTEKSKSTVWIISWCVSIFHLEFYWFINRSTCSRRGWWFLEECRQN